MSAVNVIASDDVSTSLSIWYQFCHYLKISRVFREKIQFYRLASEKVRLHSIRQHLKEAKSFIYQIKNRFVKIPNKFPGCLWKAVGWVTGKRQSLCRLEAFRKNFRNRSFLFYFHSQISIKNRTKVSVLDVSRVYPGRLNLRQLICESDHKMLPRVLVKLVKTESRLEFA